MTDLAVVLISKNQEWNIARLLESVLSETRSLLSKEIVLVDSASTDRTVDIAQSYPIDILRLRPDQRLTPAAGRYTGLKHTTGDLVLFLDGDMELYPGWLEKGLRLIQSLPDVAVATGQLLDLPQAAGPDDKPSLPAKDTDAFTQVRQGGGAALYRRSVLEAVGQFNPYLYSEEEPELCVRIRHAGHRVIRLDYPIAYHYSDPAGTLSTLVGRRRRNLYLGAGQNLRYHLGSEAFWPYFKERGYGFLPILALVAGLLSFWGSLKSRRWHWFGLWILMLTSVVVGDACRKHSLHRTIHSLLERAFFTEGTIRGFLLEPLAPDSYPGRSDVIKRASPQTEVLE